MATNPGKEVAVIAVDAPRGVDVGAGLTPVPVAVGVAMDETRQHAEAVVGSELYTAEMIAESALQLCKDGRFNEASKLCESKLQEFPDSALLNYAYGVATVGDGYLDTAIPHLRSAMSLDPSFVDAIYLLTALFLVRGDLKDAARTYVKLKRISLMRVDAINDRVLAMDVSSCLLFHHFVSLEEMTS